MAITHNIISINIFFILKNNIKMGLHKNINNTINIFFNKNLLSGQQSFLSCSVHLKLPKLWLFVVCSRSG